MLSSARLQPPKKEGGCCLQDKLVWGMADSLGYEPADATLNSTNLLSRKGKLLFEVAAQQS